MKTQIYYNKTITFEEFEKMCNGKDRFNRDPMQSALFRRMTIYEIPMDTTQEFFGFLQGRFISWRISKDCKFINKEKKVI